MSFLHNRTRNGGYFVQGKIPESLSIFARPTEVIKRDVGAMTEEAEVRPAYICDAASKSSHENAELWAKGGWRHKESLAFTREDRDNTPFTGLKVWDLEVRGEGGRAYKVITPEGYYVDLREDVFLEALVTQGVGVGGELGGDYVFAILGSQMRVVRVGSDLYECLMKSTDRKKTATIKNSGLVVGGVYRDKAGNIEVYCGRVAHDGKKKQFWFNPWLWHLKANDKASITALTQEHFSRDATGREVTYDYSSGFAVPKLTDRRVGIGSKVKLRQSHSFIEFLGVIDIGDRSSYFEVYDAQVYPEDHRHWEWHRKLKPILRERGWTFID